MRINTNVSSLTAQEANKNTNFNVTSSLEKLSSGFRINKASDDASGLAIADKLRTQASGMNQAVANGNSAITLTQIADKAMAEQSNILDIIKQKLIQASTATTSLEGAQSIGKDIGKLLDQIDNIAKQTTYNGQTLLQQSAGGKAGTAMLTFQMGVLSTDTIGLTSGIASNASGMALTSVQGVTSAGAAASNAFGVAVATGTATSAQGAARALMDDVDNALTQLNKWRADFGSTQNQLESAVRNLMTQVTNTKAAESVIRDVDYAQESANFNKQNIVAQAGTYAMSQANAVQQNVLRLLQ
jgi:flagellin